MANIKSLLGSVTSKKSKLLELTNRAKDILKIQNLFKVNKFLQKDFVASLLTLFMIHNVGFVSLNQIGAMEFSLKKKLDNLNENLMVDFFNQIDEQLNAAQEKHRKKV
ncbi:MAG: hypothetical protein LBJ32_00655 [Oscillospiraceae bacterium]|jgi:hypothetical protein|nr:hypothetical protein [Oscillospiraceae bacterium]